MPDDIFDQVINPNHPNMEGTLAPAVPVVPNVPKRTFFNTRRNLPKHSGEKSEAADNHLNHFINV